MFTRKPLAINDEIIKIDEEIYYIVRWMNEISGIRTVGCCQVEILAKEIWEQPYVAFYCNSNSAMEKLTYICYLFEKVKCWEHTSKPFFFDAAIITEWWQRDSKYEKDA